MDRATSWSSSALRRNVVVLVALAIGVLYAIVATIFHFRSAVGGVVFAPLSLFLAGVLLRRLRFDRGTIAIMLGGLGLYFLYLGYTSPGERNYDGPEQIKYLTYVADNFAIPPAKHCFICHHPPLYYVVSAVAYAFFQVTKLAPHPLGVQLFSLAIFFGFLVYGALFARVCLSSSRAVRVATAILVFWPYSFHNSVRVHNDTLVTTLVVAAMYYTARWYRGSKAKYLYAAAFCGALAILTKSSGYVVVAVLGLLLAWRFFTRPGRLALLKRGVLAMAIMGAAAGALRLRAPVAEDQCHRAFGTACDIRKTDYTGNEPLNYVYLDVPKFVRQPYMIIANDDAGKQFFWNHVLKSSLFGTHNKVADRETAYSMNRSLAWLMNVGLLAMIAYAAIAGVVAIRREKKHLVVPLAYAVMSAAFLMAFKILIPAPHHTDFRHIFFALAPGAILLAAAVEHMRSRARVLGALGTLLYVPFLAMSIVYFLPKYELVMKYTRSTTELPLAAVQKEVAEGTPWDRDGNILMEGNETIALRVTPPALVMALDVAVDGNDTYEIKLYGKGQPRVLTIKAKKSPKPGLVRTTLRVEPPLAGVSRITVRPVSGDRTYALGHLIVNPK